MSDADVAFRTNAITLEGEGAYEDLIIKDHSSGDISTEEADLLIQAVNEAFADENIRFYTGVSYRHCLIVLSLIHILNMRKYVLYHFFALFYVFI